LRRLLNLILLLTAGLGLALEKAQAQAAPPAPDTAAVAANIGPPALPTPAAPGRTRPRRNGDLSPANEQGDTQRPPPGLAGDWFGLKPWLGDAGIGLTGRYGSEAAWNYNGGTRHDIVETGQFDVGLLIDMQKLVGIDGAFQATITYRRGHDLDQRAGLQTLQQVQEVYGRGQTLRLTQFWYEQAFLGDHLDLKVGRTSPGEDFAAFSCSFQNLSFCGSQPGNVVGAYWYNWPVSQWGGRARIDLGNLYVQAAAYEENPRNLDNTFTIGHFGGATGALIPFEIGLVRGGQSGSPIGAYKIGGWFSSANAADVFRDVGGTPILLSELAPLERMSSHGFWVNIQQQLTGRSEKEKAVSGLSVFLNVTQADRHTSMIDSQIATGLFEKGLFPWFTEDVLGVGFARTHVNGRVAEGERLAGQPLQHSEYEAEIYYGFHPRTWLELRPNFQWVHHAGGYAAAREVGIVGLKTALTL
jgi:porin